MPSLWEPKRRIEQAYKNAIQQAMRKLTASLIGLNDPAEIIQALFRATNDSWFMEYCNATAMMMVTHLFTDAGRTWRQAAKVNSQGRLIYEALKNEMQGPIGLAVGYLIEGNAEYIRSVPADIARQMTEHIMTQSFTGMRSSDIAKELIEMFPHISNVKANLIARTETAKTATALTRARSETFGVRWYRWRTSEDSRVRDSHRLMDKVLVEWDDPPSPEALDHEKNVGRYHAGSIWNCRCYAEPVIDLSFIQWPCKVYRNGGIGTMTRSQFERQYFRQVERRFTTPAAKVAIYR